ncbi:hypothetical protein [Streptomyces sp. CB02009]|uniref:hypothetical protein n=1 Tax=Streptomyces sp. CB02009 TaxID=1703938 RepID=UPI000AEEA189|nr:hypothetical protein [Streptomyces sp. CB02009]
MLLLINAAAHEPRPGVDGEVPAECVGVVRAQVRLQKLDFWVRYPDYLAYELMTEYEKAPDEPALLDLAEDILSSQEPDLRRFPMLRHRFGAFEELDDALAVLVERGLLKKTQVLRERKVVEHRYYLLQSGRTLAGSMVVEAPALAWYVERTKRVVALVDGLGGSQLKSRQYLLRDYADTPIGSYITPITDQARARLRALRAVAAPPQASAPADGQEAS